MSGWPCACLLLIAAISGLAGCATPPAPPAAIARPPAPKVVASPAKPSAAQLVRQRQAGETACTVEAQQATSEEPDELLAAAAQRQLHDVCMAQRGF